MLVHEEDSGILTTLSLILRFSPRKFPLTTNLYNEIYLELIFFFCAVFNITDQNIPNSSDFHAFLFVVV